MCVCEAFRERFLSSSGTSLCEAIHTAALCCVISSTLCRFDFHHVSSWTGSISLWLKFWMSFDASIDWALRASDRTGSPSLQKHRSLHALRTQG